MERQPDATFNINIFNQCHFYEFYFIVKNKLLSTYYFLQLGGEAARCDLWHNNAGLPQIWEGSSQGPDWWKPTIVLKIAKSKSRTDKMQFLKPSRWSRSIRRSWKRWERGTRRRRWPFRSLNVLPLTKSARSVEVHMTMIRKEKSETRKEVRKLFGWHSAQHAFNP